MSDQYFNDNIFDENSGTNEPEKSFEEAPAEESVSGYDTTRDMYDGYDYSTEQTQAVQASEPVQESSYEWNSDRNYSDGEYHYSYINGANKNADHNPNNYDDAYSNSAYQRGYSEDVYSDSRSANPYAEQYAEYSNGSSAYGAASAYSQPKTAKAAKPKKEKKSASKGFVAAALAIAVLGSTALGFGGGIMAGKLGGSGSSESSSTQETTTAASGSNITNASSKTSALSTSDIVKKTANSVVEIVTEATVSGGFSQRYAAKGAGSGVIISDDGYIVTNYHVIDGANKITVTLRDGTSSYDAKLIGSDEDNDIALLKIDATGLTAAEIGNSSDLVVGDYVIAIGNPLGTLGGTVTDGIISALAREVTIENKNLTLIQTNAQISPGNSGGGLFNAEGKLIGIVNAKDSATEVEGIAFAIPINTVSSIIKDLKEYGYNRDKTDTGMEFVDINSYDSAFYYNVNQLGVYVLSVDKGSNAEAAGFRSGDLITAVNGTEVSSTADITKALKDKSVGDTVTFTVSRASKTQDISLELTEYVPSAKPNTQEKQDDFQSDDSLWDRLFNW